MRLPLSLATCLVSLSSLVAAIFADEVGTIDWHYPLLGYPRPDATFFHRPDTASKASLVYTLSEENVLGAVNPRDGSIVWRQQLAQGANLTGSLRAGHTSNTVVSGVGSEVVSWAAADGRQQWSYNVQDGFVRDLELFEAGEQKSGKDSLVLIEGRTPRVVRLDSNDGHRVWEHKDDTGDVAYQVMASATKIFYVSLHSGLLSGGFRLRISTLDPLTGKRTEQQTLGSDGGVTDTGAILAVGTNSASPIIAWTDKANATLKVNIIGTKTVSAFQIIPPNNEQVTAISVHAPSNANSRAHFLVAYQTALHSWGEVYHVDLQKSSVTRAFSLPRLAGRSAFSVTSEGSNVYFTRTSRLEVTVISSASHGILARRPLDGFKELPVTDEAYPVQAATELSVRDDVVSAIRSTVLLSSGDWVLIRDSKVEWSRPEALASTVTAAYAYPPAKAEAAAAKQELFAANPVQAYVQRWTRHVAQLSTLSRYLPELPSIILSNLGLRSKSHASTLEELTSFGFHKIIVCVSGAGRVLGIDAGTHGKTLWSIPLPTEDPLLAIQLPLLKAYPGGIMELKTSEQASVGVLFDSTTGKLLDTHKEKVLGRDEVALSASTDGITAALGPSKSGWHWRPSANEHLIDIISKPANEPVASIGRVLGDRKVLYKYLNPNLLLVATSSSAQAQDLVVTLFDSLTGTTLYSASHPGYIPSLPFAAAVSENWFAYSFTEAGEDSEARSTQLVVGEMYESSIPDDRGPANNQSDAYLPSQPYIPVQSYIIPEPISQFTVSQTGQGITSRELIALLPFSNSVVGIPKVVIDPRRPVGRDPSKTEQYEGTMRYVPNLEFDPKWYLNHKRELLGITNVTTSPALLESTSLVFAYGLDIFGTRISPSFSFDVLGKDFNKIQMLTTVAALAVLTFGVAPLVSRKQVNARWTFAA